MSSDQLEEALERGGSELWAGDELDDRGLESVSAKAERPAAESLVGLESSEARDLYLASKTFASERHSANTRTAARWLWVPAAAALATFLAVLAPSVLVTEGEFGARGLGPHAARELDVLRIRPGELAEPLGRGATFQIGERLGFSYREADRAPKSITIVAFDGEKIDWLYPERPDAEFGFSLDPSRARAGVRLPYDVELDPGMKPGPVWFLAAFDMSPAELSRLVEEGRFQGHPQIQVISLELVAPQEVSP